MNEVIENMLTRRSIRLYKPEQVREEELGLILKAAAHAPSGGNSQLWRFTAVQNTEALKTLNELVRECFAALEVDAKTYKSKVSGKKASANPNYSFYYNAPTLIIATNDRDFPNAMADCAAAIENMLLAAHSLGLGSCWINQITWFGNESKVREALKGLGIPDNHIVCGSVALGYNAGKEPKELPRKENTIHFVR